MPLTMPSRTANATSAAASTPAAAPPAAEPAPPTAANWRGVRAAIDIGSNSFRLEIGQLRGGRYRRIDYLKDTVRLGAGLDDQGRLGGEATERGLACLRRFRERLTGIPGSQFRAVATQTLREATNRNAFLLQAAEALGHPIEVISGREEARLIYKGVARLQPSDQPRLVIDIGGRSTEMILGVGPLALRAESFRIGSVSLSMAHFPDGRYSAERFQSAQVAAGAELEEALEPFARQHWLEALGSSGTAGAVSQLLAANGITDGTITPEGLRWCIQACLRAGSQDRLDLAGLKPERRAVIGGGLAILYTLATHFGIEALRPARGALRQGVIFDLEERLAAERTPEHHDLRDDTVAELQQRFQVDVAQAHRVQQVARALHERLAPRAALEPQRELGWACALHEMGMMVSHHDHHRHSAYLLGHVDAAGFSQNQQRRLGELVLGQRGGLRKVEAALAEPAFAAQLLALRLAVLLCHARGSLGVLPPTLVLDARGARLIPPEGWATQFPRSAYLLREEVKAWSRHPALKLQIAEG
jgi:exopolyphosphatase/guanosine-5'-triphosphate,3'-diphosphate pyrophosphatase